MAVVAPMPNASIKTAVIVKPKCLTTSDTEAQVLFTKSSHLVLLSCAETCWLVCATLIQSNCRWMKTSVSYVFESFDSKNHEVDCRLHINGHSRFACGNVKSHF